MVVEKVIPRWKTIGERGGTPGSGYLVPNPDYELKLDEGTPK